MVERKESVKQYQINSAVNHLLENEVLISRFFRFYNFLTRKDEFRSIKIENTSLQNLISQLNNLTSSNLERAIELNAYTFIPSEIKDSFLKAKNDLQRNLQELSGLDTLYSDISDSRNLLKEKLQVLKETGNASGECVLCVI